VQHPYDKLFCTVCADIGEAAFFQRAFACRVHWTPGVIQSEQMFEDC